MVGGERLERRIVGQVESRDLPSPLALWKEPGEQIYRRVDISSPFGEIVMELSIKGMWRGKTRNQSFPDRTRRLKV